ncbi:MAG: hypothetical protein DRH56_01915 [Deltaproteobacteria bacterium]|nr:MAG: hypothetical protein DRH56_01915 [Deltaproteobacteria bacterium]
MDKVLNIKSRLEEKRRKEVAERHRRKMEALLRTIQCTSCRFRCSMCGHHLESDRPAFPANPSASDLHLCDACQAEFEDFLKARAGKKSSGLTWHNPEWMMFWSAWLDFQIAMRRFRDSAEFRHSAKLLVPDD